MAKKAFWGVSGSSDHTSLMDFDAVATDTNMVSVTSDSMTADPETATEDGYLTITINGTDYQVPIYAA
jgi:hypothetical protein